MHRAVEALARALAPLVAEELRRNGADAPEFYDQKTSPLGNRKHRALCKSGALEHRKVGRRYLVARADMQAYLDAQPATPRPRDAEDIHEVGARILAHAARAKKRRTA